MSRPPQFWVELGLYAGTLVASAILSVLLVLRFGPAWGRWINAGLVRDPVPESSSTPEGAQ